LKALKYLASQTLMKRKHITTKLSRKLATLSRKYTIASNASCKDQKIMGDILLFVVMYTLKVLLHPATLQFFS